MESEPEDLPASNQLLDQLQHPTDINQGTSSTQQSEQSSPPQTVVHNDFEEEWARMSILTQYIGNQDKPKPENNEEEDDEEQEKNIKAGLATTF